MMSGPNKSAHGLNQWVSTDKPTMADFNADNQALENNVYWKDHWTADYDAGEKVKNAGGILGYALSKTDYDSDGSVAAAGGIVGAIQKNGAAVKICKHARISDGEKKYVNQLTCDDLAIGSDDIAQDIMFVAADSYHVSEGFTVNGIEAKTQTIDGRPLPAGYFVGGAGVTCTLVKSAGELTVNFKPGGGGIGVTVAAELPETVTHNQIIVISDMSSSKVTVDMSAPVDPKTGDIYIELDSASDTTLTSGNIILRLKKASQFQSNLWRSCEAYAGIGGLWEKFSDGTVVWEYCLDRVNGIVTYTGENASFNNAAMLGGVFNGGDWMDKWPFNEIRPCLLKEGKVQYYLDPNDYTKRTDGLSSDITTGNDGDVMIEFPLIARNVRTEGGRDYVSLASFPLDGYCANGFINLNGKTQTHCYLAAYEGLSKESKLRSLSGASTVSQKIAAFRTLAETNGQGYHIAQWSHRTLLYDLFILLFRGIDSQTIVGYGRANGQTAKINPGTMNTSGLFWGDTAGKNGVKCFGIENLWGNLWCYCDGLGITTENQIVYRGAPPYSEDLAGYTDTGCTAGTTGYVSQMETNAEWGKIPSQLQGTADTFYADQWIYPTASNTYMAYTGGTWNSAKAAGLFCVTLANASTAAAASSIGTYLSYIPVAPSAETE